MCNGTYEGKRSCLPGADQDSEFSNQIVGSLGRVWKLRRGAAALGVSASQIFYQDTTSLNDFRYDVTGALNHLITRRLGWSGTGTISSGLARDSEVLTDSGLVLPSDTVRIEQFVERLHLCPVTGVPAWLDSCAIGGRVFVSAVP